MACEIVSKAMDHLYALEFLVEQISFLPDMLPEDLAQINETCVEISFLDIPPLTVCEADFEPKNNYQAEAKANPLKSGKSVMFALTEEIAEIATTDFSIYLSILKKHTPTTDASTVDVQKVEVGSCHIQFLQEFMALLYELPSNETLPPAKVLNNTYNIVNSEGTPIGSIEVFARICGFGKVIVTNFQMNLENKTVLFKDEKGKSMYFYRKSPKDAVVRKF